VEREVMRASLNVLNVSTGVMKSYAGDEVGAFVSQYRRALVEAVVRTFPSQYNVGHRAMLPVNRLKRRPLGGQADVIRAIALSLKMHKGTVLVGEMGVGKSYMAAAASGSQLYGAARTFIQAPPHLVKKWAREVGQTVYNARSVIVRTPRDLDEAMRMPASRERPLYIICSRERAKLSYRVRPAYLERRPNAEKGDWKEICCPDCFAPLVNNHGFRLLPRDLEGHRVKCLCKSCREAGGRVRGCKNCCGTVVQTADRGGPRRHEIARYLARRYKGKFDLFVADEVHELKAGASAQGRAAGVLAAACKKAIALSGSLYSGYASGLFYLLYRFLPAFRREFAYTDVTRFVDLYGIYEFVTQGVEDATASADLEGETGAVSKRGSEREHRRERPGMSPALLLHVIECAAFMRMEDLRQALPAYHEYVRVVDMEEEQAEAYYALESTYVATRESADRKRRLAIAGAMLRDCLSYPDTCVEPLSREVAVDEAKQKTELIEAPALPADRVYPKERTMLDIAENERRRGRRCLVYYVDTHVRDVGPRLEALFKQHGFRPAILKPTVPAEDREEWLDKRIREGANVILTNPALVETGLDILGTPCVIFTQLSFVTNRVRQASRRPWRPGQTEEVDVYFLVYRATKQYPAMKLMADKVHKANIFAGDLVGGGFDVEAEDDAMEALAREFFEEGVGEGDGLEEMFAQREEVTAAEDAFLDESFSLEELPELAPPPDRELVATRVMTDKGRVLYQVNLAFESGAASQPPLDESASVELPAAEVPREEAAPRLLVPAAPVRQLSLFDV
ncbi:MAG: DEAD/DEAH box helicase, partial [Chloroflexota bacterium]|nr:DEAD/DEAH box helicase [Chloroflexota bacterium]